jgi:hypothetical protein
MFSALKFKKRSYLQIVKQIIMHGMIFAVVKCVSNYYNILNLTNLC